MAFDKFDKVRSTEVGYVLDYLGVHYSDAYPLKVIKSLDSCKKNKNGVYEADAIDFVYDYLMVNIETKDKMEQMGALEVSPYIFLQRVGDWLLDLRYKEKMKMKKEFEKYRDENRGVRI